MIHDSEAYELRAEECLRLACLAKDEMLKEQILSLYHCYIEFAVDLRQRELRDDGAYVSYWREAANG